MIGGTSPTGSINCYIVFSNFQSGCTLLAQISTAAIPAFKVLPEASVITKHIDELQVAVTQNDSSIHILAEKLQQIIEGIEESAMQAKTMLFVSLTLSILSLAIYIYLLVR